MPIAEALPVPAQDLVVQVDGGHIPIKDPDQRSFEALSGVVYRPSSIEVVDQHHRQIIHKSCVISALDDEQTSIKTYLYHAALKQGLTPETHVTALADGAHNGWSVISVLEPHCQTLELILDWFHMGMRFQTVKHALGDSHADSLEKAKWSLWHGETEKALQKLTLMREAVTDEKHRSKLKGLHDYLQNNRAYLVNYGAREKANQVFTSQVTESHIDSIINARHKRKQKMQWTREGAHNVLQIRAQMASHEWEEKWLEYVMPNLCDAA